MSCAPLNLQTWSQEPDTLHLAQRVHQSVLHEIQHLAWECCEGNSILMGKHIHLLVVQLLVYEENIHKMREAAVAVNGAGIDGDIIYVGE